MSFTSKFSLKSILTATLLSCALIPLVAISIVTWRVSYRLEDDKTQELLAVAQDIGDKIDRNLFERYGDVQAFVANTVVSDVLSEKSDSPPAEDSLVVGAMNQYVDLYDIYFLTLLVDTEGKLVAVNTKDHDGNPVRTKHLYDLDFSNEQWFQDVIAERYYESEDKSFTGTVVEHLYVDENVKQVYGDEGLALGFSTVVRGDDGEIIGVWKNVAKFSIAEEIVQATYDKLKLKGAESIELTLLDEAGNVIIDCDPMTSGSETIQRDMAVIGKLNLVEKNVEAAVNVIQGNSGSLVNSYHARKQIAQCAGYAPHRGALGFPGMKWNVLVRMSRAEIQASVAWLKQTCLWTSGIAAGAISVLAFYFARTLSNGFDQTISSLEAAGNGDFTQRSNSRFSTDFVRLSKVQNKMLEKLEKADEQSEEAAKLRRIVEDSDAAFVMVDRDFTVTYVNQATKDLLSKHQETFRRVWPHFDPSAIVGACIDQFHKSPNRQRELLSDPNNLPYKTDIKVGPLDISLNVTAVFDAAGNYVGNALEWKDVTEERQQQERDADFRGQIAAIDASQAVIEFKLDGTIVSANDNFLSVTGYRLDEIAGKHHRMFVEPEYASSSEYREFWERLNRGEFVAGEFKRIANGGKEIWIQASYNPIFDKDNKPAKVVKYASDITASKAMEQEIRATQQREQQQLEVQKQKVAELLSAVNAVAEGDLSVQLPELGDDAIGQVATGVGKAVDAIRTALTQVRDVAETVTSSSQELASISEQISSGAQEQASSLEETAASLEEITSAVKQNTDNSQQAQQLSSGSREVAESGGTVVSDAVNAMTDINSASKKIAEIITTIDEIAFQTNLLALNAAVEAARAGEQGRGFAVVASEVRNLAQRSAGAAKEIKNLIQDSVTKVENGTELVNKSGTTLDEIVTSVKRVADIVTEISAASTEQLTGIEQVNTAISQMDRVTQTNAAQTEEMTGTSQTLLAHSDQLRQLVATFRLGEGGFESPRPTPATYEQPAASTPVPPVGNNNPTVGFTGGAETHELDMIGVGDNAGQEFDDFVEF